MNEDRMQREAIRLAETGATDEAIKCFLQLRSQSPGRPSFHLNLGIAYTEKGLWDLAFGSISRAIELDSCYAEALLARGNLQFNHKRLAEAARDYRQAIAARPEYYEAILALGTAELTAGNLESAIFCFKQSGRLAGDKAESREGLATCYLQTGEFDKAARLFEQILETHPMRVKSHIGLGTAYRSQGKLDAALHCYEYASCIAPNDYSPRWNRSLVLLTRGEFDAGFREFEYREYKPELPGITLWRGEDVKNRRMIIVSEQGLGDTFQFIRFCSTRHIHSEG